MAGSLLSASLGFAGFLLINCFRRLRFFQVNIQNLEAERILFGQLRGLLLFYCDGDLCYLLCYLVCREMCFCLLAKID